MMISAFQIGDLLADRSLTVEIVPENLPPFDALPEQDFGESHVLPQLSGTVL
jgi:hypothetical protein